MNAEQREKVESLCLEALSKDARDRAAFLDEACGADPALRREVESLLAGRAAARTFLETPGWAPGATPLERGTHLGPYEIQSFIGAGGMGEVYKARDTRLNRAVAIKMLPPAIASDPERRARFEREARAVAALNHPHICTVHDVGDHDGSAFLVMEHIAGETLAARLRRGPLPLDQALSVATDIADALAAAHRSGVVHRDLKPGNVMLTKAGAAPQGSPQAKLLDFGLAKLRVATAVPGARSSLSTHEKSVTVEGTLLGTVPYMAPEQLEGKEADARSDIFSFGAVLYEMLAGKRAFDGESQAGIIAAILEHDPPPLASLQPYTPPAVERLVRQCLAKSPDDRPDTAHDVANELRWMRDTSSADDAPEARVQRRLSVRPAIFLSGLVAAAVIGVGLTWLLRPVGPRAPRARFEMSVHPADNLNAGGALPRVHFTPGGSRTALTWTPDGQALVFVGRQGDTGEGSYVQQLYVRRLDDSEARVIKGTEGAQVPAVSPDGQWVAFWVSIEQQTGPAKGAIRKAPLGGGAATELMAGITLPPWGLVWDDAGGLLFGNGSDGRIWRIGVDGVARAVTKASDTESHILPWPLPGAQTLLYTVRKGDMSWRYEEIVAEALATGRRTTLIDNAADARYIPATGHLVFLRLGKLWAVPFDANRLQIVGKQELVLDDVAQALTSSNPWDITGAGQFAVAATGMLAWVQGPGPAYPSGSLVMVDRRGQVRELSAPHRNYVGSVGVSPFDGRWLAVSIQDVTETGVWLYDLERPGQLIPLVRGDEATFPRWSPDGRRLVFRWRQRGRRSLAIVATDAMAEPQRLVDGNLVPAFFTRDGRQVVAVRVGGAGHAEGIVIVNLDDAKPSAQPLTDTRGLEQWPALSPDGRWLAYSSRYSGRYEVYVRPYPGPGRPLPVSIDGGSNAAWHPSGRELFFLTLGDGTGRGLKMMASEVRAGSDPGIPRPLFSFYQRQVGLGCILVACYSVTPDGEHFYGARGWTPPALPAVTRINVIQGWFEDLKQKVPVRK